MRKIIVFLVLALAVVLSSLLGSKNNDAKQGKLQVMASFYPMAEFARAVGGDRADVLVMVPDGVEPHDWEPAPSDLTRMGKAQLFVYNGLVEPWAEQALLALSERKLASVEAGAGLYEHKHEDEVEHDEHVEMDVHDKQHEDDAHVEIKMDEHAGHNHDHGGVDPHVWISPKKAIHEVEHIRDAFMKVDAAHAEVYQKNAAAYIAELAKLDAHMTQVAQSAPKKVFVTAHAAFGHLACDYGLEQLSVAGLSPEAEPTPADLQRLIAVVKREQVRYVFFETLTEPKIAELVAQETGAKTAVLDPLEGLNESGRQAGLNYLKIMDANIKALEQALKE